MPAMDAKHAADCECCSKPDIGPRLEGVRNVGIDMTHGRYGEVVLLSCPVCSRLWLFYRVEYEAFTASGRWFRGVVTPEVAESVTPETAAQAIARSGLCIYGGSHFRSTGEIRRGPGPVEVDLMGPGVR